MLDYEDAMLPSYPETEPRRDLITAIRSIKPDVVFTWLALSSIRYGIFAF